jgi:predicted butyrate kinase (DUF1464 family)
MGVIEIMPDSPVNFMSEQPASQAGVISNALIGMKFHETCDILTKNNSSGEI